MKVKIATQKDSRRTIVVAEDVDVEAMMAGFGIDVKNFEITAADFAGTLEEIPAPARLVTYMGCLTDAGHPKPTIGAPVWPPPPRTLITAKHGPNPRKDSMPHLIVQSFDPEEAKRLFEELKKLLLPLVKLGNVEFDLYTESPPRTLKDLLDLHIEVLP